MPQITTKELLDAGVHFGHLKKKWNPKMLPYIFDEKKGIHIIDLNKTQQRMEVSGEALKSIARSGKKILFVATKKQAKEMVKEAALSVGMPFVTERWLGGMLTNFSTIRKSIKKMQSIDRMLQDGTLSNVTKKERLMLTRQKSNMERVLGGIANLNRLPAAVILVDITHEHIALKESRKLNINTFGMVDTNSDPTQVDFPIPANDDATKSIQLVVNYLVASIKEGLAERDQMKTEQEQSGVAADGDSVTVEDFEEAKAEEAKAEATEEKSEAAAEEAPKKKTPRKTIAAKKKAEAAAEEAPEEDDKTDSKKTLTLKKK